MKVVKLSGVGLAEEVFGDKVVKVNTWLGTGYEKGKYTVLRRPVPPWSRERFGPSILPKLYPNIANINKLFASAASRANVDKLHSAGLKGRKFLKYRAKFIGRYVREKGNITIESILPTMVIKQVGASPHVEERVFF